MAVDGKGGSIRRKQIFPEYKANRKKGKSRPFNRKYNFQSIELEKQMMDLQLSRLFEYFDYMPITKIMVNYVEADDIIAHIATTRKDVKHIIMSADKDFLQLCSDNVTVWSPTKKILYDKDRVLKEFGIPAHNLALYRALDGDKWDGIPGIAGWGAKTILKKVEALKDLDHIYNTEELLQYAEKYDIKKLIENKDIVERNYALMQLNDVDISQSVKTLIDKKIEEKIPRLTKYKVQVMVLEDKLFTVIKNSTRWLAQVFNYLDACASRINK